MLSVPHEAAGKRVKCRDCGQVIKFPEPGVSIGVVYEEIRQPGEKVEAKRLDENRSEKLAIRTSLNKGLRKRQRYTAKQDQGAIKRGAGNQQSTEEGKSGGLSRFKWVLWVAAPVVFLFGVGMASYVWRSWLEADVPKYVDQMEFNTPAERAYAHWLIRNKDVADFAHGRLNHILRSHDQGSPTLFQSPSDYEIEFMWTLREVLAEPMIANNYAWDLMEKHPGNWAKAQEANTVLLSVMNNLSKLDDGNRSAFLDTLALSYYRIGEREKALSTQQEALNTLAKCESSRIRRWKSEYEKRLSSYEE